ncbi:ABC transporter permease [Hymenobacter sp. H14-R3]|uniref:ABC transporter permease subunit n=1 Tax=Hymenobacter sp. H14-R3 TaxID=3046308 RepID=UPI0024BB6055|nr:ABC transporter permease [Hymenobacter sp. H14-R3]MDJ0363620.1 ABC transporter permease [Hymenobacter sp. H14-R3]
MARWLLARLGRAALAAWGIASLVFLLSRLLPGGPEQAAQPEAGDLSRPVAGRQSAASQALTQQALRQRLGLAEPVFYVSRVAGPPVTWRWNGLHNQYHRWAAQVLRGNLGQSYRNGQPVTTLLAHAIAYSLPLAATAAGLAVAVALGLGLYLARTPHGWLPALVRTGLAALQVTPLFLLALVVVLLFANPDALNLLPDSMLDGEPATGLPALGYWLARAALPLLSLVLAVLPSLTLPLAAALHDEAALDYATTARAKGLTVKAMLWRHALPNALLPLLTTLTELLPTLVAGTVVVEVLFTIPGSGRLLAEAAAAHDYPLVIAGVLLTAAVRLLSLVLADVLYFLADPRLRPTA